MNMEIRTTYTEGDYNHKFETHHQGQRIRIEMSSTDGGAWSVNGDDVKAILADTPNVSIDSSGCWYGDGDRLPGQVDFGINALVIDEEKIEQAKAVLAKTEAERDMIVKDCLEDWEEDYGEKPTQADEDELFEDNSTSVDWAYERLEEAEKGEWEYAGYEGGPQGYNSSEHCLVTREAEMTEALEICDTIADAIRQATKKIYNWQMECRPCDADSSWEKVA